MISEIRVIVNDYTTKKLTPQSFTVNLFQRYAMNTQNLAYKIGHFYFAFSFLKVKKILIFHVTAANVFTTIPDLSHTAVSCFAILHATVQCEANIILKLLRYSRLSLLCHYGCLLGADQKAEIIPTDNLCTNGSP